jgi:hypothetical protein
MGILPCWTLPFLIAAATALPAAGEDPDPPPPGGKLKCGQGSSSTPTVGVHCATVAAPPGEAANRAGRLLIEAGTLGLGKPACDDSNCGLGQTCEGGSQVTAGSITWDYTVQPDGSTEVCATVAPGTTTQQHCANCS